MSALSILRISPTRCKRTIFFLISKLGSLIQPGKYEPGRQLRRSIGLIASAAYCVFVEDASFGAPAVVEDFGTYNLSDVQSGDPSASGLPVLVAGDAVHVLSTHVVIGSVGTVFGFRWRADDCASQCRFKVVMNFPKPGIPRAGTERIFHDQLDEDTGNGDGFIFWRFRERDQIVPGDWSFEVWMGNRKIASEKFHVILPPTS